MTDAARAAEFIRRNHLRELRVTFSILNDVWLVTPLTLVATTSATVVLGFVPPTSAWLLQQVLDALVNSETTTRLWVDVALLVALGAITALVPIISRLLQGTLARSVSLHNTETLYASVNSHVGLARFETPSFRDQLQMAQEACQTAPVQLMSALPELVRATISLSSFIIILLAFEPWVAAMVLTGAVPSMALQSRESRRQLALMWRNSTRVRRTMFFSSLMADTHAVKEVRLFGLGEYFRQRMSREIREANLDESRMERQVALGQLLATGVALSATAVGTVAVVFQAVAGGVSVGDLTLYLSAIAGTQSGALAVATHAVRGRQAASLYHTYIELLSESGERPTARVVHSETSTPRETDTGLEFRDVWFRYSPQGPWALQSLTFRIPSDTAVGLVGLNGAGKSTVVKLVCRLYDPERGAVLWNGRDVRDINPSEFRSQIGAIFQDFMTYDLTAFENIALGDLERAHDSDSVRTAAEKAGADRFIQALPAGYKTMLSRSFLPDDDEADASLLSGGQWQRLALARTMMRLDRPLLVMDEPTSSLDPRAEDELQGLLTRRRPGQSVLCVSHRLATVRDCDSILVIDAGRLVEEGTHAGLIRCDTGLYRELYDRQAKGYTDRPTGTGTSADY